MFVSFESLEPTSRVWIYQSNKAFSNNEIAEVSAKLEAFVSNWKRHGEDLKASFQIKYNQFIILAVDEKLNPVSGCSIDASVNFIKQIEQDFNCDLTNKLNVSFKDNSNINIVSLADFQKYAKAKKITSNTIVFNNMVTTKGDFENKWEVPASQSWHQRFLQQ